MSAFSAADVSHFSTDALPVRDRLPVWIDVFGRTICKVQFEPLPARPFRQAVSMRAFDELGLMAGETNGVRAWRDRTLVAAGNDDLVLMTNLFGNSLVSQLGRELTVGTGAAVMLTSAETGLLNFAEMGRFLNIRIPRRALVRAVANPESAVMRTVPASSEALRLLVDYIAMTSEKHELATPQVQQLFAMHVHDLVALTIGATRDAAEIAQGRGLRAARLNAIKADIVARLGDEGLSVAETALRHRVTPRYVHMLFETEGVTFSEYVIERRLARAYRMMQDQNYADRTISAVAFEVGFSNLSHFNRVFRRRYGATPSEVRALALRGDR